MTAAEIVAYYVDLLIVQYNNRPRARATVGAFVAEVVAEDVINQVREGFDLETAVGAQLDILGTYRGVSRQVFGISPRTFFALCLYADAPGDVGFAMYADADEDVDWFFFLYADVNGSTYTMNDEQFRAIIGFLAAVNSSPLALVNIDEILLQFFGEDIELTDNGDMTITYEDTGATPNEIFSLVVQLGILPKPAGVEVIVA